MVSESNRWYPYVIATSPNPPAPTAPAIAVAPTKPIVAVVTLNTREANASGNKNRRIICNGVAPMDLAASIIPASTSKIEFSTNLEIYGQIYSISGTIAADVPIDVLTINRVNGIITKSNIINGIDRRIFTIGINME